MEAFFNSIDANLYVEIPFAVILLFTVWGIAKLSDRPFDVWLLNGCVFMYLGFVYIPIPFVRFVAGAFLTLVFLFVFENRRRSSF